jgi:hypothetical protein
MRRAILILGWLLVTSGCGGLDNGPLLTGLLVGRVAQADPSVSLVSVLGRPEHRDEPEEDGTFELQQLPPGTLELFVVASPTHAARVAAEVVTGRVTDVGEIQPAPAGGLTLKFSSSPRVEKVRVWLEGTPYESAELSDERPSARMGPLPAGCYAVTAAYEGGEQRGTECLAPSEERERLIVTP